MSYSKLFILFNRSIVTVLLLSLIACSGKGLKKEESQAPELAGYKEDYQAAILLIKEESFKDAASKLEKLIDKQPQYPGPYVNLGIALFKLGDYELASEAFEQVLSLPSKQEEKADIKVEPVESINLKPFQLTARNYLGLIAREKGSFDKAEEYYRKALEIDSEHPATLRNLAILLDLYKGKIEEAVVLYEKYQSLLEEPDAQVKDWIFDINARLEREGG